MKYRTAALEKNRLVARPRGVPERADSLGGFVGVCSQEVVQALVSGGCHEPLAIEAGDVSRRDPKRKGVIQSCWITHMYGPGRPLRAL